MAGSCVTIAAVYRFSFLVCEGRTGVSGVLGSCCVAPKGRIANLLYGLKNWEGSNLSLPASPLISATYRRSLATEYHLPIILLPVRY